MPSNSTTPDDGPFSLLPPESKKERRARLMREAEARMLERNPGYKRNWYFTNRDRLLAQRKAEYQADPGKYKARVRSYKHRIKSAEIAALLVEQDYRCAICRVPFNETIRNLKSNIDHDHKTGHIRGILCRLCNTAIGHAQDDPSLLIKMANYLRMNGYT